MRVLSIPPAAQRDDDAIQMISAWIAERGLHATLNIGMWKANGREEGSAWGIFLADLVRHISHAVQEEEGVDPALTRAAIVQSLLSELEEPTSPATGHFSSGHS